MSLSITTLALARKEAKKNINDAVTSAFENAKAYTDEKVGEIVSFRIEIVDNLPSLSEADPHKIYFLNRTNPSGETDYFYEYMVINNQWEIIGSTELDLSGYWTIDQVKDYIQSQEFILPIATISTLGGVKPDGESIQVDNTGVVSIVDAYIQDLTEEYMQNVGEDKMQNLIDENFANISNNDIGNLFQ